MAKETRVHVIVEGLVQGVGYRYFALGEARSRGLCGWVRNRSDGSVEALVEGPEGLVKDFVQRLKVGPSTSHVTAVHTQPQPYSGEFDTFAVRN